MASVVPEYVIGLGDRRPALLSDDDGRRTNGSGVRMNVLDSDRGDVVVDRLELPPSSAKIKGLFVEPR